MDQSNDSDNKLRNSLSETQGDGLTIALKDRYTILSEISRGAMGVIYHARDKESGQAVALKFILGQPGKDLITRFQREAEILIRLHHPHIIEIRDFGIDEGRVYFAMEFISGHDLKAIVDQSMKLYSAVPYWQDTLPYFLDICDALEYCHKEAVIHRDLKPQNILIENDSQRAILADFGLIKQDKAHEKSRDESADLTKTGEMVGTPAFMSPEQFSPGGKFGAIGVHTDIWAFGATLYYCLTGAPPFPQSTPVDIFQAIMKGKPVAANKVNPDIPEWLSELCEDCLIVQSAKRPAVSDIKAQLSEGLGSESNDYTMLYLALTMIFISAIIFGGAFAFFVAHKPVEITDFRSIAKFTNQPSVKVEGVLSRAGVKVNIGKQERESDGEGHFDAEISLKVGMNKIRAQLPGTLKVMIVDVVRDNKTPSFKISQDFYSEPIIYIIEEDMIFKGLLLDDNPLFVRYEGKTVKTVKKDEKGKKLAKGAFQITVTLDPTDPFVELLGQDQAGNSFREKFKVITREKFEFQKNNKALFEVKKNKQVAVHIDTLKDWSETDLQQAAPLFHFKNWQICTIEDQDLAIEAVGRRLMKHYEHVGTKEYKLRFKKTRIASFRHRKTKLILQLLPGQSYQQIWWSIPSFEYNRSYLMYLSEDKTVVADLRDTIEEFPFPKFKSRICENLKLNPNLYNSSRRIEDDEDAPWEEIEEAQKKDNEKLRAYFAKTPGQFAKFKTLMQRTLDSWKGELQRQKTQEYIPPFLLGQNEVSQKIWFEETGPVPGNDLLGGSNPKLPIHFLTFHEVKKWLKASVGGLRLPSEHEWKYGALGNMGGPYFWGNNPRAGTKFCWSYENERSDVHANNEHEDATNTFGLIDVQGNVAEWTEPMWIRWHEVWVGNEEVTDDFELKNMQRRGALMGGSIRDGIGRTRPTHPLYQWAKSRSKVSGFRVAASLK
jgi:serine/threonine protein kinase